MMTAEDPKLIAAVPDGAFVALLAQARPVSVMVIATVR